jgi:hypothetical protein
VEVTLTADWQVGDTYRIEHLKERRQTRNGVASPALSSRSFTEVRVAERNASGYVLISTLVEADLSNYAAGPGGAEAASALIRLFQDKPMEIVTNEAGLPVSLRNAGEIVELMRQAMDEVVALTAKSPQEQAQIQSVIQQMMTPEVIQSMALKDATIFYGLMGGSYSGGPTAVYSGSVAFPFTQSLIEASLYVLLRRVDDAKGEIHIATQSVPNSEQLRQATADWMTRMLQSQGRTVPDDMPIPTIRMQDSLEYVYDRERGLPREVTFRRYLGIDEANKRVDRDVFRLVEN